MSKYNYNDLILEKLKPYRLMMKSDDDLEVLLSLFMAKIVTANSVEEANVLIESAYNDDEIDDRFKLLILRSCECAIDLILGGTQPAQAILLVINYLRK